jgi:hypothetical protein
MVFVDRQQGGLEKMARLGFAKTHACYLLLDLVFALGELKLTSGDGTQWTTRRFKSVEKEIAGLAGG